MERIATASYEACRNKKVEMEGFPDFAPLVDELKRDSGGKTESSHDSFKVTSPQPCGALVVKEPFFQQFAEVPEFESIISDHNEKYNPDGVRLVNEPGPAASPSKPEPTHAVLLKTSEPLTAKTLVELPNPSGPPVGHLRVLLPSSGNCFELAPK